MVKQGTVSETIRATRDINRTWFKPWWRSPWDSFKQGQWLKVGKGVNKWKANCAKNGMGLEQMVSEQTERMVFPWQRPSAVIIYLRNSTESQCHLSLLASAYSPCFWSLQRTLQTYFLCCLRSSRYHPDRWWSNDPVSLWRCHSGTIEMLLDHLSI